VDVNRAGRLELLRVPGFGTVTVGRILKARRKGARFRSLSDIGRVGRRLRKAEPYITFGRPARRLGA